MKLINRDEWTGWKDLPTPREGNTGKYEKYQDYLYELVSELKPNRILEVGFNAGHSACCFLNAYPNTELVSFDICRHGTEQPGVEALQNNGFNITLIEGDSVETIPSYFEENSDKFDFIFIDGCHKGEHPYYDIINTMPYLSINGIVVVDDYGIGGVAPSFKRVPWGNYEEQNVPNIEKRIKVLKKLQ